MFLIATCKENILKYHIHNLLQSKLEKRSQKYNPNRTAVQMIFHERITWQEFLV
uniref:Uncharacterized protein n=1 Tax=Arundo donax TaxID=35708 RepID=A0A0A9FYL3_ARUDO